MECVRTLGAQIEGKRQLRILAPLSGAVLLVILSRKESVSSEPFMSFPLWLDIFVVILLRLELRRTLKAAQGRVG